MNAPSATHETGWSPTRRVNAREFYLLWMAATVAYGVGDLLTTIAVIDHPQLREANGLLLVALEQFGLSGIVGAKVLSLVFLVLLTWSAARTGDRLLYYFFPLLTLVVGVFLTVFNARLLLG